MFFSSGEQVFIQDNGEFVTATGTGEAGSTVVGGQHSYIVQVQPARNFKLDLLQSIWAEKCDALFDFPIFCQDGIAWSNLLILASISNQIKVILQEMVTLSETCFVLPEVTKMEFTTFHQALFAKEGEQNLEINVIAKVARILGVELVRKRQMSFILINEPYIGL